MTDPEPGAAPPSARSVVVVIPTYNERENLGAVVTQVLGLGGSYRVIVVDDASPDGTGELVLLGRRRRVLRAAGRGRGWSGELWWARRGRRG